MNKQLEFNFEESSLKENLIKASNMISENLESRSERRMDVSLRMKIIFEKYLMKGIDYNESMIGKYYETFEKY